MGFGNLLDGIKSAGHWALSHCGDALKVANKVHAALDTFLTTDETIPATLTDDILAAHALQTNSEKLAEFHRTFGYVSEHLSTLAKKASPSPPTKSGEISIRADHVVGIWKNPSGLDPKNNYPSREMYQDLSTVLANMGVPPTAVLSGKTVDTLVHLGATIFSNTGGNSLKASADSSTVSLEPVTYNVPFDDGSRLIAAHVYYPIPMGKSGIDYSLHSAIDLTYTTSRGGARAFAEAQKEYNISEALEAKDGWVVTMNLTWASAPTAINSQKRFTALFSETYNKFTIVTSKVQGTLQLLKVQTGVHGIPADVRAAVQDATQRAINSSMDKSDETDELRTPKGSVEVRVTDVSWLSAKAIQSEDINPSE